MAWRRFCSEQMGQTTVEYLLAVLFLAVAMGYSLPVLFHALADLFTQIGAEFAKPYP